MERRPGRPSKGERRELTARLPPALAEAVQEQASVRGTTINDLIGELLAAETGVPYQTTQEALPMR